MGYQGFEELEVYKTARELRKHIYQLAGRLPESEKFGLAAQMRRAAVSLTNNIAEAHGRFHYQETIQFCRQARGSLSEWMDDMNICLDETYYEKGEYEVLRAKARIVQRLLNGFIGYLRKRKDEQA